MRVTLDIVIPAYNAEEYIKKTLVSICDFSLNNLFLKINIIIINDGSTDKTLEIINCFNVDECNVSLKIINQNNAGVSTARNTGIDNLQSNYVIFLDADDCLNNIILNDRVEFLLKNEADCVSFSYEKEIKNKKRKLINFKAGTYSKEKALDLFCHRLVTFGVGNTIFKTEIIKNNMMYFPPFKYGEDSSFTMRYLSNIKKSVYVINQSIFCYNYNDSSVMNSSFSTSRYDSVFSVQDTRLFFKNKNYLLPKTIDFFELNEFRGVVQEYIKYNNTVDDEMISFFNKRPVDINIRMFFCKKRTFWFLCNYVFYKYPMIYSYIVLVLLRVKNII